MKISLIVATAQNGVIGRGNQLIWHLPNDLKQFKRLTTGHPIIMGRKTFESIGKPLPNRTSIVISRNNIQTVGTGHALSLRYVNSLENALEIARQTGTDEAFVIGGAEIYRLALPLAHKIYLTEVKADFDGDAFFAIPDPHQWRETSRIPHPTDEKHAVAFDFVELERV
ncbi:MAG: dihydrofolate reductase [Spirosomaceae bacterium]|jgi:dihydrofolate reductase|nr:dihydrofolate reductase [Spirosomataceae bacterium]